VFIDAHLRLEAFESQDHLAKLIRDAGKGLGNCRKDLLSLDPSTYTLQSIGPVLDKATGPTIMFVDVFSQLLLQQPNIFFISRISVATLSYAGLKQLIRRRALCASVQEAHQDRKPIEACIAVDFLLRNPHFKEIAWLICRCLHLFSCDHFQVTYTSI
jgi:hypothetical protein